MNYPNDTISKNPFVDRTSLIKKRALLTGSSILQRVKRRGLSQNVDIMINRGARVSHIRRKLEQADFSKYRAVLVQAGGNDIAEGRHEEAVENDFVNLVRYIKTESPETTVYISELPQGEMLTFLK